MSIKYLCEVLIGKKLLLILININTSEKSQKQAL